MSFDFLILLIMTRKLALLAQDESIDDTLYELDRFLQKGFFPIELYLKVQIYHTYFRNYLFINSLECKSFIK